MKFFIWISFSFLFIFSVVFAADDFVPFDQENLLIGTSSQSFIIDTANTGGDLQLQFGETLAEYLQWVDADNLFELSQSLRIQGNLEITETELTFDSDNVGAGNSVRIIANQGSDLPAEIRYNATTNQWEYSNDGGAFEAIGSGGGISGGDPNDVLGQFYDGAGGLNVNVNPAVPIPFNQEVRKDVGVTHSNVTNNSRITLDEPGWYLISYNISIQNASNNRLTIGCFLRLNGTTFVPGTSSYSYSRNNTDNFGSNAATVLLETTNPNEYYEVMCQRNGSAGNAALTQNESGTLVQKLDNHSLGGGIAPYLDAGEFVVPPSSSRTISLLGNNFTPTSTVSFPGFTGTINSTTVVSPSQIDVDITSTATTGTYDIVVDSGGVDNTVWSGNGVGSFKVELVTGTGSAGTYTEGFESGLGSWVNSGLGASWTRQSGGTPSAGTGPNSAATGSFYIFTETSNPNFPNVPFGIETTDFAVAQSVSFDYHMHGADIGTLDVQTLRSGVWATRFSLTGQQQAAQGDAYLNQLVDLSSFDVEGIRFLYTSGSNWAGDAAIDNIVIISN